MPPILSCMLSNDVHNLISVTGGGQSTCGSSTQMSHFEKSKPMIILLSSISLRGSTSCSSLAIQNTPRMYRGTSNISNLTKCLFKVPRRLVFCAENYMIHFQVWKSTYRIFTCVHVSFALFVRTFLSEMILCFGHNIKKQFC